MYCNCVREVIDTINEIDDFPGTYFRKAYKTPTRTVPDSLLHMLRNITLHGNRFYIIDFTTGV